LLSRACRNCCSEAAEALLDVSVDVDPVPLLLPVVVDPAAADPEAVDVPPVEVVLPLEVPVVDDVDAELADPVNALTRAWKSCCSLASTACIGSVADVVDVPDEELALDPVVEEDPEEAVDDDPDEAAVDDDPDVEAVDELDRS
jgi:hypothetical protein